MQQDKYTGPFPKTEGRKAGESGQPITDNPYPKGSAYFQRWVTGYQEGLNNKKQWERAEKEEAARRERQAEIDRPWTLAKFALRGVFTDEQENALCDMLDSLRETIENR